MTNSTFASDCLRKFTADILSARQKIPERAVQDAAVQFGVSADLLTAIALIERDRRPGVFCLLEKVLTLFNILLYAAFGIPVRNVSLGLFQIKIETAARLLELPIGIKGDWLSPEERLGRGRLRKAVALARVVNQLTDDAHNSRVAARLVAQLRREWRSVRGSQIDFLSYLGQTYNGEEGHLPEGAFVSYALVLEGVLSGMAGQECECAQP